MSAPVVSRVIQAVGVVGLALVVLNAFVGGPAVPDPALERAAVLGSVLAVLLLLVGLLWQRVEPLEPDRVPLEGLEGFSFDTGLAEPICRELAWGSTLLLTATPAACVLVHWRGRTILRRGLQPVEATAPFEAGPICERCLASGRAISLVDLRLYPGRDEFTPLLSGLPAVVVQPLGTEGLVLLGGWSPRCFSRSDLAWLEGWARRLAEDLDQTGVDHPPQPLTGESVPVSDGVSGPAGVSIPPAPGSC
jgi:hypothetical protein